ncbi:BREX system ATP-binding domain-containing protein [Paractinoplanes maris]|uniref:BREX system ATP-binding domain-containing protein n=1 Tax=Paractinoplanes maris TaxID=1734446 RepID=UPI0020210888|nr:BREX system ATP-binding domain-containing protein [Actinoplanes maris]
MTDPQVAATPAGEINPFPSSAVAQVAQIGADTVTIPTDAIRQATAELKDYLANTATPAGSFGRGRVVAIVGDYGSGKSHLAFHLLSEARAEGGRNVQGVYLSSPPTNFIDLYRDFARNLYENKAAVVEDRVRQMYAEVVADSLANSPVHEPVRQRLLDAESDPKELVRENRWAESIFLSQVQERLAGITDNRAFITALTLLMRDGFSDAVWEWFQGNEPGAALRDRGIVQRITAHEGTALEAMGVFALLIAHGRNRFVVVIDEVDQLLSAASLPTDELLSALKKLLTVFADAGAFLVLAGLPDFLNTLRQDVRERIGNQVHMTALTADDVVEYIKQRQERALGERRLQPFTEDTVRYIVEVANGMPRHIVALCYFLYRRSFDEGVPVNDAMVRTVARENLYVRSTDSMHAEVRRVLTSRGLTYYRDRYVGATQVAYYVPLGEISEGRVFAAVLLVTRTLLDDSQFDDLLERIAGLKAEGDHEVLLVVVGLVPERYQGRLRDALGRDPLAYDSRRFIEQLEAELKAMERGFERLADRDPVVTLLARVDRMGQQLANTQGLILRMASHLDTVASTSEQRVSELARQLGEVIEGSARGERLTTPGLPGSPAALPAEVAGAFNEVLGLLDVPRRVTHVFDLAFRNTEDSVSARRLLRMTLRHEKAQTAAGVSVLLQELTESYRSAVTEWYRDLTDPPAEDDMQRLKEIGQTFTLLLDYLPTRHIEPLADFSPAGEDERADALGEDLRARRVLQTSDALEALSGRVEMLLPASMSEQ